MGLEQYKGRKMPYETFRRREKQLLPQDAKTLNKTVDQIIAEQNANPYCKFPVDIFQTTMNEVRK